MNKKEIILKLERYCSFSEKCKSDIIKKLYDWKVFNNHYEIINHLINNNYITINEKKLLFIDIKGTKLKRSSDLQDANIKTLSNFIFKVFNQIKIIDSTKSKDDDFVPSYLR